MLKLCDQKTKHLLCCLIINLTVSNILKVFWLPSKFSWLGSYQRLDCSTLSKRPTSWTALCTQKSNSSCAVVWMVYASTRLYLCRQIWRPQPEASYSTASLSCNLHAFLADDLSRRHSFSCQEDRVDRTSQSVLPKAWTGKATSSICTEIWRLSVVFSWTQQLPRFCVRHNYWICTN